MADDRVFWPRWTPDLYRKPFTPRTMPLPSPDTSPFDAPRVVWVINQKWLSHVLGAVDLLAQPDSWVGTDTQVFDAIQDAEALMSQDLNIVESNLLKFRTKPNDPNYRLQVSFDGGANYNDTLYDLTGYDSRFLVKAPTGIQNTITVPDDAVGLRILSTQPTNEFVPFVIDMPFSSTNASPLASVRGRNNQFNSIINAAGHFSLAFASGALPTATAQYRGSVIAQADGTGFKFFVCVPNVGGTAFYWKELAEKGDRGTDGINGIDGLDGTIITDAVGSSLPAGSNATLQLIDHPNVAGTKRLLAGIPRGADGTDGQDGANGGPGVLDLNINPINQDVDQSGTLTNQILTLNLHKAITNEAPGPEVEAGEDTACNQSAAIVKQVEDFWTILSNQLIAASSFTTTVYSILSFITSLPSLGFPNLVSGAITAIGDLVDGATIFGVSVINADLTNLAYDELKCILYCAMGIDANFTDAEFTALIDAIDDSTELGNAAKFIMTNYFLLVGINRANAAHLAYRVRGEDCSACDCAPPSPAGVYNFVGGMRGWEIIPENEAVGGAYGGFYSSGWHPLFSNLNIYMLGIRSPIKAYNILSFEFFYDGVQQDVQGLLFAKIGGTWTDISFIVTPGTAASHKFNYGPGFTYVNGLQCSQLAFYMGRGTADTDWRLWKIILTGTSV